MKDTLLHGVAIAVGMALAISSASAQRLKQDSLNTQGTVTVEGDTLREVIIEGDRDLPIEDALRNSLGNEPRQMSLGDVLDRLSPGLNDKILHPFAVKQRKKERRRRRWMERIEEFDKVQTFDDLLREAYERQMLEDSIARIQSQK